MRSSTTLTSAPRAVNGASLWHSMKLGRSSPRRAASSAGLKRSICPTCSFSPCASASSVSVAASALVTVIGFSTSTCTPRSRKKRLISKCALVDAATLTASTESASSR